MTLIRKRSGTTVVRSGSRRQTAWIGSALTPTLATLGAATVKLDQSFTGAQVELIAPFTIVRTIGTLWVQSDQEAADEECPGALGMIIVNENARAAGVASILAPWTNSGNDAWFVHLQWMASITVATAVSITAPGWQRYDFDSKAQRKVQSGDAISVLVENGATAMGARTIMGFRQLIKMH